MQAVFAASDFSAAALLSLQQAVAGGAPPRPPGSVLVSALCRDVLMDQLAPALTVSVNGRHHRAAPVPLAHALAQTAASRAAVLQTLEGFADRLPTAASEDEYTAIAQDFSCALFAAYDCYRSRATAPAPCTAPVAQRPPGQPSRQLLGGSKR
ncbi:hypothetical protein HXX76_012861 [Chlamydomonas incerta]|uniref:Uncharacterized protein n=1 Tax=Chlamydomonas incerta TaxID=51695 RepID=A0A835VUY3_CHLIN|nr:hypothetical protein HXX76_012861 [Chlamydomonas incerta]|eukprot:KAG2426808.1 hypothetical protein HXX76_012861 [Chlamydomonas incerta]